MQGRGQETEQGWSIGQESRQSLKEEGRRVLSKGCGENIESDDSYSHLLSGFHPAILLIFWVLTPWHKS